MSSTTMKSILRRETSVTPEQSQILADYEVIKALCLFPGCDWQLVDDYEITHYGMWCHQVLTAHFWGFFKPEDNTEKAEYDCAHLKFRFRHLFNVASGLSAEVPYPFNMDYPAFAWKSKEEDTPENTQFRKSLCNIFV